MHSMQNRMRRQKEGFMALKLDISKAYDRVEWNFLKAVMQKMGFDNCWFELIMQCVSMVSYFILFNGTPHASFKPLRGLRQGDPLSPYLFVLCSEILSFSLNQAEQQGLISGNLVARGTLKVNHLFFADDSLVICEAIPIEWSRLHSILGAYEQVSGQRLNLEKTSIFFSKNTKQEIQHSILAKAGSILAKAGIQALGPFDKYLGLHSYVGKHNSRAFNSILDRIKSQMGSWKTNLFSTP